MEKKAQPSALKNYQDFAKQYKEEFNKVKGSKPLDIQIKDAYTLRKSHGSWDNFLKEHKMPEVLKEDELKKYKEEKKIKKDAKAEKKKLKAEKSSIKKEEVKVQ